MAGEKHYLTEAGLKELEEELRDLELVQKKQVAKELKAAREQGDLSENAEYTAAKEKQREIESKIEVLQNTLKNVIVVLSDEIDLDKVGIGCAVQILNMKTNRVMNFRLVGSVEANSMENKLSNESPVGKALEGRRVGDIVDVEAPAGHMQFKVLKIERPETEKTQKENIE